MGGRIMKESYALAIQLHQQAVSAGAPADVCLCCEAEIPDGLKGCFELFSELCALGYTFSTLTAQPYIPESSPPGPAPQSSARSSALRGSGSWHHSLEKSL